MVKPENSKKKSDIENNPKEEEDVVKEDINQQENKTKEELEVEPPALPEDSEDFNYQEALELEKEKFLRLFAEFENYKKRTSKERLELFKTAGKDVILTMLPVLDDFDRAIEQLTKAEDTVFTKGIILIRNKFFEGLKSKGLEVVEVAEKVDFNPDIHEAVTQIPAPKPELKSKVIDVIEKGYKLGDKIIRYPKVIIGQ